MFQLYSNNHSAVLDVTCNTSFQYLCVIVYTMILVAVPGFVKREPKRPGVWGSPEGPQWVQGKTLVGAKGAKPLEVLRFWGFLLHFFLAILDIL